MAGQRVFTTKGAAPSRGFYVGMCGLALAFAMAAGTAAVAGLQLAGPDGPLFLITIPLGFISASAAHEALLRRRAWRRSPLSLQGTANLEWRPDGEGGASFSVKVAGVSFMIDHDVYQRLNNGDVLTMIYRPTGKNLGLFHSQTFLESITRTRGAGPNPTLQVDAPK